MIPIDPDRRATPRPIDDFLVEDKARGDYRLHRSAFTDEMLFELEMKHIFEGNWIYLAHESQLPNANDYYTTTIGRQPIVIARNRHGELNAFVNACTHRGAMLCRHKRGNRASYTCPFHGWTFSNGGKLLKVKDPEGAGYPDCFNRDGSHDLKKVARFENYRGFLFGSLNPEVEPLAAHLGDAARIIDMIVDQSADGLEVLRGSSTYTYEGNWKLTAENGADGYHVSAVHWNYAATVNHRKTDAQHEDTIRAMDAGNWGRQGGGFYAFDHGHMLLWTRWANPEDRPNFDRRDEFAARCGGDVADWMIRNSRNLCLYPNVYLMDQFGSQIRVLRPLAVDRTEVTIYCIAPKGEAPDARAAHPPVRGFLQRERNGDARRSRGIPRVPAGLRGPRGRMERHVPRRLALDRGPRRSRAPDRHPPADERREDRGRRAVHGPAPLLDRDDEAGARRRKERRMKTIDLADIQAFLYRESRLLDDKAWDAWLDCYRADAVFWMPSWDDADALVTDPQREISLIYYPNRQGLEDRVFRIKTERSSATVPDTRTSHNIANVERESADGDVHTVRFNWHTLSYRYKTVSSYFGMSRYAIDFSGDAPKIVSKYVVLKNDYINQLIDIYHI